MCDSSESLSPKAETLGYESLWVQEQIITDALILEPVTLLSYAAALSSRPVSVPLCCCR